MQNRGCVSLCLKLVRLGSFYTLGCGLVRDIWVRGNLAGQTGFGKFSTRTDDAADEKQ